MHCQIESRKQGPEAEPEEQPDPEEQALSGLPDHEAQPDPKEQRHRKEHHSEAELEGHPHQRDTCNEGVVPRCSSPLVVKMVRATMMKNIVTKEPLPDNGRDNVNEILHIRL